MDAALAAATTHPLRYGVVDMGSNALRAQIVEIVPGGGVRVIESRREPVRLGRDVFLTGAIPEASVAAAVEVFRKFRELCDRHGVSRIRAIATSATREAMNREVIIDRIERASGIAVEVITGSEEAYLLGVAVKCRIDLSAGRSLLVDLGGGSVEVTIVEDNQVALAESYRLGALRLLQALTGKPGADQGDEFLNLLDQYVGSLEGRIADRFAAGKIHRYVATGGNIEDLADLTRADGKLVTVEGIEAIPLPLLKDWARRLAMLSYADRMREFAMKPDRADTILPATVVYYRLGMLARVDHVLVPRVGLRDGLVQELIAGHPSDFRAMDHQETVLAGCRTLARKFHSDLAHAERVRRLATQLFDGTHALHGLGAEERILLEAAALLHDVGIYVSNARHHKHSYYLIRESDLVGLSRNEREIVALLTRYHRKAPPHRTHDCWRNIDRADRARVAKLVAILRVADALDREHQPKVASLDVHVGSRGVEIRPVLTDRGDASSNLALERWAVEQKGAYFQEVFGVPLRLEP